MAELAYLQEFHAPKNKFTSVPKVVCAWKDLKAPRPAPERDHRPAGVHGRAHPPFSLDMWSNDLEDFPQELEGMTELKFLDLRAIQFDDGRWTTSARSSRPRASSASPATAAARREPPAPWKEPSSPRERITWTVLEWSSARAGGCLHLPRRVREAHRLGTTDFAFISWPLMTAVVFVHRNYTGQVLLNPVLCDRLAVYGWTGQVIAGRFGSGMTPASHYAPTVEVACRGGRFRRWW